MKLEIRDEKVCWVKADGTLANKPVSEHREIDFLGFPISWGRRTCKSIRVLLGDPYHDENLIVTANGSSWWGHFLLGKDRSVVELCQETLDLINEEVLTQSNAKDFRHPERGDEYPKAQEVDAWSLVDMRGLVVVEDIFTVFGERGRFFWIPGENLFTREIPPVWFVAPEEIPPFQVIGDNYWKLIPLEGGYRVLLDPRRVSPKIKADETAGK